MEIRNSDCFISMAVVAGRMSGGNFLWSYGLVAVDSYLYLYTQSHYPLDYSVVACHSDQQPHSALKTDAAQPTLSGTLI